MIDHTEGPAKIIVIFDRVRAMGV